MHPVLATEAIQWAELRQREQLVQAEIDQLALNQRHSTRANIRTIGLIAHPIRVAAIVAMLVGMLVVAAI